MQLPPWLRAVAKDEGGEEAHWSKTLEKTRAQRKEIGEERQENKQAKK
jgi:hypothetical protein